MSLVRFGKRTLSSSRPLPASNRHNSIFSAFAEKIAKFVPMPSKVAPSGRGVPAETCISRLRNEENRGQWRYDQAQFASTRAGDAPDQARVAGVAAAIEGGVGIEHFSPCAAVFYRHAIV